MKADYKGYRISTWPEQDNVTGLWNGRYRILDDKEIVAYESFAEPVHDENEAHEAANVEARAWIDKQ
ncbi:MAG: hypothetical protein H0X43_02140 [Nitrosospira sp.]|nr:hypothetical protein [Nitrosospira sp.]